MLRDQAIQNDKLSQLSIVFHKAFHRMKLLWLNDSLEIIKDKIQVTFKCIPYVHYDTVIESISYLKKTGILDKNFILTKESLAQTSTDDILRFNIDIKFLKKIEISQNDLNFVFEMGMKYENGIDVVKDEKEAARYYQLAADQEHVSAQYNLGILYEKGRGVLPDDSQALHYIELAANQEHLDALHNLSIRHSMGRGVPQDVKKANHFHQLATTVGSDDSFRQFISNIESETSLIKAPSLLLKISEKTSTGISIQGLYEYIFSPNVDLSRSFVPWNAPLTRNQRGPTCGLNALEMGLAWCYPNRNVPPARKNPIKPTATEKEKNKKILSLRQIAKKHGSVMGEVLNINCLESTAKEFNFNECKRIKMNKKDRAEYTQQILRDIRTKGCSIILPVDNDEGFPGNRQGKGTHYGLAWGYICIDNQYYFIVAHHGKNCLWSADALQKSHEQLPDTDPNCGEYYKDRVRNDYYPKEKDESVPKNDLRQLPPSDLGNFKFTALTIPTSSNAKAKNVLVIDETKIDNESIYAAVKSGDSVMLKLLLEKGFLRSSEDHQKLKDMAKMGKNMFALQLLNDAKPSSNSLLSLAEKHENKKIDPNVCGSNDGVYPVYFTPKPKAKEEWEDTLSKSTLKSHFRDWEKITSNSSFDKFNMSSF